MTVADLSPQELDIAREAYAKGSTDKEWALFLADCKRYGISPLDKKLHFQVRKAKKNDGTWDRRYAPVTSIDYMREVADATSRYAGSDKPIYAFTEDPQKTYPVSAEITVFKMVDGQRCAYSAIAFWDEYYPGDGANGSMWRKMPRLMLAKCAEALALRKGFPGQLAGLYERAEMQQADDTAPPVEPPKPLTRPAVPGSLQRTLTQDERNELLTIANGRGWAELDLKVFLTKRFNCTSVAAIHRNEFSRALDEIEKGPQAWLQFDKVD